MHQNLAHRLVHSGESSLPGKDADTAGVGGVGRGTSRGTTFSSIAGMGILSGISGNDSSLMSFKLETR